MLVLTVLLRYRAEFYGHVGTWRRTVGLACELRIKEARRWFGLLLYGMKKLCPE